MNTPDDLSQYYAELLEGVYDCVDRIVLNAFFPLGQTGGGVRSWWRELHGDDSQLDDKHLREMAGTFARRLQAFCAKQEIAIIEARAGERKHELAEPYVPKDPAFHGLFLVITGNAPAPIWEVKRNTDGRISEIRHRKNWPFVKHYHFHIMDGEWGHVTIRMCGYPPFGAQLILNGHEWVEREARRKCLTAVKDGNCFVEGSDLPRSTVWRSDCIRRTSSVDCANFASDGSTRPAFALRSPMRNRSASALPTSTRCFSWNSVATSCSCVEQR